jgi:single-strand DNA-binding protein
VGSYNKAILMGNLTRDPELSYTSNNTPLCKFGVAINESRKGGGDKTHFIDCTAWGKTGETINQYVKKGDPVLLEGRLNHDTWKAQDGTNRSKVSVTVERFTFVGGRARGESNNGYNGNGDSTDAPF